MVIGQLITHAYGFNFSMCKKGIDQYGKLLLQMLQQ